MNMCTLWFNFGIGSIVILHYLSFVSDYNKTCKTKESKIWIKNSNLNHNMYSFITGLQLAEYLALHMYDIVARKRSHNFTFW